MILPPFVLLGSQLIGLPLHLGLRPARSEKTRPVLDLCSRRKRLLIITNKLIRKQSSQGMFKEKQFSGIPSVNKCGQVL